MGLDTSHDCWHGPYSAFMEWRDALSRAAGFGSLEAWWEQRNPPAVLTQGDPLVLLLQHSDCDGELMWQGCEALALRLTDLLPALAQLPETPGAQRAYYVTKTEAFIKGLHKAFAEQRNVEFH